MLADKIHGIFTQLNMHPWVDELYVKLQFPNRSVSATLQQNKTPKHYNNYITAL